MEMGEEEGERRMGKEKGKGEGERRRSGKLKRYTGILKRWEKKKK